MHNNVVSGIFKSLIQKDISCFRFNFRGVGESTGSHSNGSGERSDVKACIDYLINEKNYKKILICGYSYGAAIGCSTVNYSKKIIGYCAISFPWDFMNIKYKKLAQSDKPKLFIQGDKDDIAQYSKFQENFNFFSSPKKYVIIEGADHFYWGYEDKVNETVLDFYKSLI